MSTSTTATLARHSQPTVLSTESLAEIANFYQENGYYVARGLFDPTAIREIEAEFDRVVVQMESSQENINARWSTAEGTRLDGGNTVVLHTHNYHRFSARLLMTLLDQRYLDIAEALLGPDIILHHTKLFQKPPAVGAAFPAHQDWQYFPTKRDTMLASILHVTDATDDMGCVRVFPGSHRIGRQSASQGYDESFAERFPLEKSAPIEAQPGDVLFFNYFTVHGSMPNRSGKNRKTLLTQLHAGTDELEDANTHPNCFMPLRGWNYAAKRSNVDR